MISPKDFVDHLGGLGVSMFVGVPDSLLKPLGQYVMSELPREQHIITADEGAAVGVALGHYLRTETPALVYLQNSGFGNTVNPLLSLADPEVYGTPMVLVVGWRGQPGVKDEPQHVKQGRVMTQMIEAMELPYVVLPSEPADARDCMTTAVATAIKTDGPYIVLVEKGTFESIATDAPLAPEVAARPSREDALAALLQQVSDDAIIVATTGMLSRELFELREKNGTDSSRDFLTVGGMGHASAIALGVAQSEHDREVWCFDGDGAALMHLGTMANIADHGRSNYFHAVFNNGVHDSVGGQPTSISVVNLPAAATAMGYRSASSTTELSGLAELVAEMREQDGPSLVELNIRPGARADLGRPTRTPAESRQRFVTAVSD